MAQPPAYARAFSFTDYTANYPSLPQPGVRLDNEFNAIATTLAAVRSNLSLIQRDDGALKNESVGPDQLSPELTLGLRSVSDWAADTAYIANDAVWESNKLYRCLEAHTSAAAFSADLAAVKWVEVVDLAPYAEAAAEIAVTAEVLAGIELDVDLGPINTALATKAGLADNNAMSGNNTFSGVNTFSVGPVFAVGSSTTLGVYLSAQPTNYGVGHPRVYLRKRTAQNEWELRAEDSAGTAAVLDLVGDVRINGEDPLVYSDNTALLTQIRKAKHLSLAYPL